MNVMTAILLMVMDAALNVVLKEALGVLYKAIARRYAAMDST
jgi:hypothetical protein